MVNNIPVNGWPQLKDLEAVQPTLDRLDKIEAWKRTVKEETFTGEEITIPNALALPARSLKTTIEAIQDLHGYDKPWAGGASKQLIPMTVANIKALNTGGTWSGNVYIVNGGTIEMLVDNADNVIGFKINGTFNTSTTNFRLVDKPPFNNVAYKISGAPANSAGKHIIQYSNFVDTAYQDTGSGADFTGQFDYTAYPNSRVVITVYPNITVNNVIIRPMICLASATDPTTFAPYSNICPISGRTAVNADDTGLNQFDKDHVSSFAGFIDTATNTYKSNSAYKLCYIPCDGNTTYTISKVAGKTFRVASSVGIPAADVPFINTAANHTGTTLTFTTAADAHYLAVLYWSSANGDTLTPEQIEATLQIEIGSTATPYVPYAHSSATIQLGTTVYGADINWDTGVASVLRRAYDMGELNYEYLSDNNAFRSTSALPDATTENVFINSISSIYKEHQTGMANMTDGEFRVQGGIIYLKDFRFTSASDLKTALSGQTVVYDRATPTTIQLTPTQLQMLKGYNHITLSDGYGTIELKALTGANWS